MAAACAIEPTGMAAVLGGDESEVLDAIAAAGLSPANRNGAGQIVAAGPVAGIEKLTAEPPARARIIPLSVAGAFHTQHMAPAETALASVASGITPSDPTRILLSNLDGTAVTSGPEVLRRLVAQVTAPVRWDLCMSTLADLGVTAIIELPPAGALAGLAKRALKGVEIVTLNTPDDLPAARDLIAHHAPTSTHEPTPHFSLVVASTGGNFIPASDVEEGADVKVGTVIGSITTRQGPVEVATHAAGVLTEWLAHNDDPVSPGQPLARIGGHTL
jgi:[acyl-carrier-protein] S-malonyltransferase